jgi:NAD(P)-dependent dehydrogenase (short-subunit alcohol dehydrogenase family)
LARLIQLVTPTMREQGAGRIINVSSVGGRIYEPFGAWYHATKFAVEGLSDSLRLELKPFGIDVVVIQPAAIVTEWNRIARDSLLERSGDTAYATYAKRAHAVLTAADEPGGVMANTPDVVGRKIAKAATAKRPAARYPVGRGARAATSGRDLLPDAVFDQIISRTFGSR